MTINDGGPAHPVAEHDSLKVSPGMTLRDYFAAKFSVAWVHAITASHAIESREDIAIEANRLGLLQADHMLAQREKP